MKKYLLAAAVAITGFTAVAQVSGYRFMHEFGQLMDVENYPGAVIINHDIQDDFLTPGKVKLPFPFRFGGQLMDSVGVHENGYLFFGSIDPFAMSGIWPISSVHTSQVKGVISALGIDLHPVQSPSQTTTIKSAVVGTAPMRIFIAEYKATTRIDALNHPAGPDSINFQIKLYETTNRVEIAYGLFKLNPNITDDAEIGIKGAHYDDYANRVPDTANWARSVPGTTQMARVTLKSDHKPEYGTLFAWEPDNGQPTAIIGHEESAAIRLYPVPATDVLHLDMRDENNEGVIYHIADLSGKMVLSGKSTGGIIKVQSLRPGVYTLMVTGKNGKRSSKLFSKS